MWVEEFVVDRLARKTFLLKDWRLIGLVGLVTPLNDENALTVIFFQQNTICCYTMHLTCLKES